MRDGCGGAGGGGEVEAGDHQAHTGPGHLDELNRQGVVVLDGADVIHHGDGN